MSYNRGTSNRKIRWIPQLEVIDSAVGENRPEDDQYDPDRSDADDANPSAQGGASSDGDDDSSSSAESDPEPSGLPKDVCFDILKNERRRHVVTYVKENGGTVSLGEVAEYIAALENGKEQSALDSQERKRVYVGLYQCHLPRMDDADVVSFDKDRGTIELGENAPALFPYLDDDEDDSVRWAQYYLGYSVLGGVLLVGSSVALPGVVIAQQVLVAAVLVAVAATSFLHFYREEWDSAESGDDR